MVSPSIVSLLFAPAAGIIISGTHSRMSVAHSIISFNRRSLLSRLSLSTLSFLRRLASSILSAAIKAANTIAAAVNIPLICADYTNTATPAPTKKLVPSVYIYRFFRFTPNQTRVAPSKAKTIAVISMGILSCSVVIPPLYHKLNLESVMLSYHLFLFRGGV